MNEANLREDLLQKDLALRQTQLQRQSAELKARETQTLFYQWVAGTTCFALVVSLIFFRFWKRNTTLKTKHLKAENRVLEEKRRSKDQRLEIMEKMDMKLLETQLDAEDKASTRIGKDLHARLGSKLAVVQMSLDGLRQIQQSRRDQFAQRINQLEHLLEDSCDDVRHIAHDLIDRKLKERGLVAILTPFMELIPTVRDIKVCFLPLNVPPNLPHKVQNEVAAIVKTLVNNVLIHTEANELTVQLFHHDHQLQVSVEDNGEGFILEEVLAKNGRGLKNTIERIRELGAEPNIDSTPGHGTTILFQVSTKIAQT
ncbi:MAG: sensor histidine kinase [Salibacteraceae bacterium]